MDLGVYKIRGSMHCIYYMNILIATKVECNNLLIANGNAFHIHVVAIDRQ